MEIKIDFTDQDVEDLVCKNIQPIMFRLAGPSYHPSVSGSFQVPQFRVIERGVDLGGIWGKLDILVADHKNTTYLIKVCKGEVELSAVASLIHLCGTLRQRLIKSLLSRLKGLEKTASENQPDVSKLVATFEEDMVDRWKAVSVMPVVVGSRLSLEALGFAHSLNLYASTQHSVSSTSPVIFCGVYQLSISISSLDPISNQVSFEVQDAFQGLPEELSMPQSKGTELLEAYTEETCDRLIRDFLDYEQHKKAHKSGVFRVYKEI